MFNFQDIHIGIRVPNLEEAMREMGSSLNITGRNQYTQKLNQFGLI